MSRLLETIRIENGVAQHLEWHQARVRHSRRILLGTDATDLPLHTVLQNHLPQLPAGIFKCRIIYREHIESIDFQAYVPRRVRTLQCVDAREVSYALKWADRSQIEACWARRGVADDVLMIKNGLLTDTSFANVALWDGHRWHTPARPLLNGTCRRRLMAMGILTPSDIRTSDLPHFQKIRPFNAMLGWSDEQDIPTGQIFLH